jgi:membrane associated rhomboid family serine protease
MLDWKENVKQPAVIGFAVSLLLIFLLSSVLEDAESFLALSPANTIIAKKYVWNLLTCSFYETNIVKLCCDLLVLVAAHKTSVRFGDGTQFTIFLAFSVAGCGVLTFVYCMIRFFATGLEEMLIEPMYGFSGTFIALAMFYRVQLKDAVVIPALPMITYHNLPIVVLVGQFLCYSISPLKFMAHDLPFSFVSIPLSWSYLKFFYKFEDSFGNSVSSIGGPGSAVGEEFNFVNMFPEALHVVVSPLTTAFYNLFALIGVFPELIVVEKSKQRAHHLFNHFQGGGNGNGGSGVPGSPGVGGLGAAGAGAGGSSSAATVANAIEDRRRAKALKLLDAKMAELEKAEDELDAWGDDNNHDSSTGSKDLQV